MNATSALITFAVGVGGVVLGAILARRNEQRATADRLLAEALNDLVAAIAEVAGGAGSQAQWRYGSAVSRIALHASLGVVEPLRSFQDDATTGTVSGRDRLITVVNAARVELGQDTISPDDLAVLLFGAHRGPFELAWAEHRDVVSLGVEPARSAGATSAEGKARLDEARAEAAVDPRLAMRIANSAIDNELKRVALGAGLFEWDVATLLEAGVIRPETAHALEGVRALTNIAAHGPQHEPSPERLEKFLVLVDGLLYAITANATSIERPGCAAE